jgi:hypothetical protein
MNFHFRDTAKKLAVASNWPELMPELRCFIQETAATRLYFLRRMMFIHEISSLVRELLHMFLAVSRGG